MEVLFTLGDRNLILNVSWSLLNIHLTEHNSILQTSTYADAFLCYRVVCKLTGKAGS